MEDQLVYETPTADVYRRPDGSMYSVPKGSMQPPPASPDVAMLQGNLPVQSPAPLEAMQPIEPQGLQAPEIPSLGTPSMAQPVVPSPGAVVPDNAPPPPPGVEAVGPRTKQGQQVTISAPEPQEPGPIVDAYVPPPTAEERRADVEKKKKAAQDRASAAQEAAGAIDWKDPVRAYKQAFALKNENLAAQAELAVAQSEESELLAEERRTAIGEAEGRVSTEESMLRADKKNQALTLEKERKKIEEAHSRLDEMEVDPGRFWKDMGTGRKVGLAIAMAAEAIGQAFQNRKGPSAGQPIKIRTLDMIDAAIERDIDLQLKSIGKAERSLDRKERALGDLKAQFADDNAFRMYMVGRGDVAVSRTAAEYAQREQDAARKQGYERMAQDFGEKGIANQISGMQLALEEKHRQEAERAQRAQIGLARRGQNLNAVQAADALMVQAGYKPKVDAGGNLVLGPDGQKLWEAAPGKLDAAGVKLQAEAEAGMIYDARTKRVIGRDRNWADGKNADRQAARTQRSLQIAEMHWAYGELRRLGPKGVVESITSNSPDGRRLASAMGIIQMVKTQQLTGANATPKQLQIVEGWAPDRLDAWEDLYGKGSPLLSFEHSIRGEHKAYFADFRASTAGDEEATAKIDKLEKDYDQMFMNAAEGTAPRGKTEVERDVQVMGQAGAGTLEPSLEGVPDILKLTNPHVEEAKKAVLRSAQAAIVGGKNGELARQALEDTANGKGAAATEAREALTYVDGPGKTAKERIDMLASLARTNPAWRDSVRSTLMMYVKNSTGADTYIRPYASDILEKLVNEGAL